MALNLDVDEPSRKRAAQRIFGYIRDELRGDAQHGVSIADIWMWNEEATGNSVLAAGQALANIICAGVMPPGPIQELCSLIHAFSKCDMRGSPLESALTPWLCPRCKFNPCEALRCECKGSGKASCVSCDGSGKFKPDCRACSGTGQATNPRHRYCPVCRGYGKKAVGDCRECQGLGQVQCVRCELQPAIGEPRPVCTTCAQEAVANANKNRQSNLVRHILREEGPPPKGVSIERCNRAELTRLQNLWLERESQQLPGGHHCVSGEVLDAWKVDNP